ncbi:hypothetical protein E2562_015569 [Oryza meyeriana var. granulata]|uniref:BHLH domain-containing protein n=1 Tax=Oryza meyeriana var. granulata TaxID=110450 RepID=A0A6G1CHY5_9ORYZ|nr:hypothetical protein E2562_015569 [Oryza meyeriana var. granulata]
MEDSEAMAQLLGVQYFANEQQQQLKQPPAMYWPGHEADQYYGSAPYCYMQQQHYGCYDGGAMVAGDFFVPEEQLADPSFMVDLNLEFADQHGGAGSSAAAAGKMTPACKRKVEDHKDESTTDKVARKKARSMAAAVQKKGKNVQSKKAQKGACSRSSNQQESNGGGDGDGNNVQSSSNYLSDDDSLEMTSCSNVSSASKKSSSSTATEHGAKARAGRGAATDPQSLYARKRRERINERLKILQNLIPNGTKVDISTMLEEAVHYVKFLQLQIKLLSSDDMWMFAPIAYNGVNVGLDLKISPPQQQ